MRTRTISSVRTRLIRDRTFKYPARLATADAVASLFARIVDPCKEHFIAFALNTKNDLIALKVTSMGNHNSTTLDIPDIMRFAVLSNAAAILVAHNHPSRDLTPSSNDIKLTRDLKRSLNLLRIVLHDHLVIQLDPIGWYSILHKR